MNETLTGLSLLSAMITPAVLISACGTLVFSTSTRLARVVDRVRQLSAEAAELATASESEFTQERVRQMEVQLGLYARRSRLVQGALTAFYVSLGLFVAATVAIGLTAFVSHVAWVPSTLGVLGTLVLFAGSVLLISETRLAVASLEHEMESTIRLFDRTLGRRTLGMAGAADVGRGRAGLYATAGGTAVVGLLVWLGFAVLGHVGEGWDNPRFYQVGVPLLGLVSLVAGFLRPRGAVAWGLTTLGLVPLALLVANAREQAPLTSTGVMVLAGLAVSLTILSLLGAGARWAMRPGPSQAGK